MAHETLVKFNYPLSCLREYSYWVVLLRPVQVTLGSLVLVCKEEVGRFPDISDQAFAELKSVVGDIEDTLDRVFGYDKINYLMLMMVDKHVHYHVLPRYSQAVTFEDQSFVESTWPGPPDITANLEMAEQTLNKLKARLQSSWPS